MSISSIMQTGLSALAANQQAMKAVSTNVANVNTVGYTRLDAQFVSRQESGGLAGVEVQVNRIANTYLAAAEMRGASDVSAADVLSQFMDRAQGLLGDPSGSGTVFATLDPVFSAFGALSVDPASALRRSQSLSSLQTMLAQFNTTQGEIQALRDEANARIIERTEEANTLMASIAKLNQSIQHATVAGLTNTQAETEQQGMLDRLAEIIDIRVQQRPLGGKEVRTTDGILLVDLDSARLGMSSTTQGEAYRGVVMTPPRSTSEVPLGSHLNGGEIKGLLRTRDKELVDLQMAFAEFAAGAADALNTAHNAGSSFPAPPQLIGRNTGLVGTDLLNFTGRSNIAVVDDNGLVVQNFVVDFTNGEITDQLGATTTFANSVGDLAAQLDAAMSPYVDASFANGSLQLTNQMGAGGLVVADDPASPATRAGKGFAATFGLNDIVSKAKPITYTTGLSASDPHGFTTGQTMRFAIRAADGSITRTVDFTITAAMTNIGDIRNNIDAALNGYAASTFDATGRLTLVPANASVGRIDVIGDTTIRGDTGLSFSDIFGLGETIPLQRSGGLNIRADIAANPNLIATATANLPGKAVGERVLSAGDGGGALLLEASGSAQRQFGAAGSLSAQVTSVGDYAARLAGHAGARAVATDAAAKAAESVRDEVKQRRQSEEGVNLDEELVKMTTYQQAFAAASRMITAARDLYDITLNMV